MGCLEDSLIFTEIDLRLMVFEHFSVVKVLICGREPIGGGGGYEPFQSLRTHSVQTVGVEALKLEVLKIYFSC